MKKKTQTYRVMIIPENNGTRTLTFHFSGAWVSFLLTGIVLITGAAFFLMYKSVQVTRKLQYYNTLQIDNDRLIKENNQLHAIRQKVVHLDSITTYFEQLSAVTTSVKKEPGTVKNITADVKVNSSAETMSGTRENASPSILPVHGWITQKFTTDTMQEKGAHPGIDIAAPAGIPIEAPASGNIVDVLQDDDYGTMVVMRHNGEFVTRYGHCAKAMVSVGDKIAQGQVIATVGNTGHSSAPHLHYEVIKNGKNVDPLLYMQPNKTSQTEE